MKPYLFKTPSLVYRLFPSLLWQVQREEGGVYLTFDDGPTPEVTPYVLDLLDRYHAKATFFCIGKNIEAHPEIFKDILARGHRIGNHTHNHLNAQKWNTEEYLENVRLAETTILKHGRDHSISLPRLFRPPYGRITGKLSEILLRENYRIVMWSLLSADFDLELDTVRSLKNLKKNSEPGSIIVFHDSVKAYENLKFLLPEYLEFLKRERKEMKTL